MEFLRQCTHEVTSHFPGVSIIAEEWPGVRDGLLARLAALQPRPAKETA